MPRGVWNVAAEWVVEERMREQQVTVLVVDANTAACERVRMALGEGYSVRCATSPSQALASVVAEPPDMLVCEVDLPESDGFQLCEQVRALPQAHHMPIMLLTDRASIQDKVAGFQAGADDYVVKPFDTRLFHARVRLLCRIKGLEHPRRNIGA